MADKKVACYICKGCGLGDRLDTGNLKMIAEREAKAQQVRDHAFLCSAQGVQMIKDDIANEGITHACIAACSRRVKTEAFHFPDIAVSRASLREGVIWVRPDEAQFSETTQEMAADTVRMGVFEVQFMRQPKASGEQGRNDHILVVGGGVTGLTAAVEAARAGYRATIVEKSAALGGAMAALAARVPDNGDYAHPMDTGIDALIAEATASDKINVVTHATVTKTSGAPGRFCADITIESGATQTDNFGAIIQATGFKHYDADRLTEFDYRNQPDVITQMELEALAKAAGDDPIRRPSDQTAVKSVLFIQCAGQRSQQDGHLPYCSGHCCLTSIKQAMYFKDRDPGIDTLILFDDLRAYGSQGEDVYRAGQQQGITFAKGRASAVTGGAHGPAVTFTDLILDTEQTLEYDLVVLATGMIPNAGPNPYIDTEIEEAKAEGKPQSVIVKLERQQQQPPESILNLDYRQGTDLPHLAHGFADSHFICFPYETRRSGIYAAGPVRRPMDARQAMEDGTGAALKAIQALENAAQGRAAHPRSGDLSYPLFRKEGCTQCKRCTVECPFGAINEDEQRYPQFNESRCRRCGTCMGACPVRVISFDNYSVDTIGQAIKNIDMPDEFDEKPRILVLACQNDALPALDMAAQQGIPYSEWARVVPVRCLGSVNTIWISDALNAGYDGIVLMGCRKDDDYQCHFVRGAKMADTRMSKINDTLNQLSLEQERVVTHEVAITDIERAPKLINDMADTIEKIGLSPFKF